MRSSSRPREAEHALGNDVAEHLGGARLDGVAAAAELLELPVAARLAVHQLRLRAVQLERELGETLVLLRPVELDAGALGAGNAGLHEARQRAVVRQLQRLD